MLSVFAPLQRAKSHRIGQDMSLLSDEFQEALSESFWAKIFKSQLWSVQAAREFLQNHSGTTRLLEALVK